MKIIYVFIAALSLFGSSYGQMNKAGLGDYKVTSFTGFNNTFHGEMIVAGTADHGLFFHSLKDDDSVWINTFTLDKNISCVYAQNLDSSRTKLFWAMLPDSSASSPLIYSNVMPVQSAILREDSGLDRSQVKKIRSMAGFDYLPGGIQMPLFCCTNDPCIYKYEDRKWIKSWKGPEYIMNFNFVYAKDSAVWAGGVFNAFIATPVLMRSKNLGLLWDTLMLPIGEVFSCYSIATLPGNPDHVFVGLNEHILLSTDGGKNWENSLSNVNNVIFTGILINPEQPDQIYAGGKTYDNTMVLFRTDDGGKTWKQLLTDCNCIFKGINAMTGAVIDNKFVLFLGTDGQGIFTYSDKVSSAASGNDRPAEFTLYQNYPNPFNPVTVIKYRIPMLSRVTLTIYDILGREVVTLVDKIENAGLHNVLFKASNLPSGIYFGRLTAGSLTAVNKMILMK